MGASTELEKNGRIPALDGVRGIAILMVMIFHFSSYGRGLVRSALLVDRVYYQIAGAGWIGVDLFFVLSGFLITGILYDTRRSRHYFRNFYARRVLRIFPLYYGALFVFLVLLPRLLPGHAASESLRHDAAWYWTYLSNVRIALDGWPEHPVLVHFWSLAVEEQFYLLWPLAVLALDRRQLQIFCLVCVAGALVVRVALLAQGEAVAAFVLTPARMDALAAGGYLALLARGPSGLAGLARWGRAAAVVLAVTLLTLFVARGGWQITDPVVGSVGHTLLAGLGAAVLLIAVTARGGGNRVLGFFGRYSYGLYVLHYPLLFLLPRITPLNLIPQVLGSQLPRQLVFLMVGIGASVVLALFSWKAWEERFLKAKEWFPYERAVAGQAVLGDRGEARRQGQDVKLT